jgi:hypothetical protein
LFTDSHFIKLVYNLDLNRGFSPYYEVFLYRVGVETAEAGGGNAFGDYF